MLIGGSAVNATDLSSYSFTNLVVPYGPDRQRVIYAYVFNRVTGTTVANALPNSVMIGGVTTTLLEQVTFTENNTIALSLYAALVPAGETVIVATTYPATQTRGGAVIAATIAPRITPRFSGTLSASGTAPISGDVIIPRTGFVGVLAQDDTAANPLTFTGAGSAEVVDSLVEAGTQMGAATLASSGVLGVSSANDGGMIAAWLGW
ncbi:hypothetical protein [Taklimakanibacter deserti]|uniref:hypothetical protein n=1 Tax=Taklimakanibacter deserti TaxID=2267839 RepID=UPI000E65DBE4